METRMNLFGLMEVSGAAMKAERIRAEVVASNMANAETTRTADGGPYRRQHVVFGAAQSSDSFASQLTGQGVGPLQPLQPLTPLLSNPVSASQSVPGGVDVSAVVSDPATTQRR